MNYLIQIKEFLLHAFLWSESTYWGTFWGQFLIELAGGTTTAVIFLFLVLMFLKPKVSISPFLCKSSNTDSLYYVFKFVNKSFFTAHEVKVELYKIRKIPMGGGKYNNEHLRLSIKNGEIGCVPKNPFLKRNLKDNPHCVVVRSFDNINSILEDEMNAVLLRISLKHGLSGLSSVFEHEYGNEGDIRIGRFTPGSKFDNI